ncbi:hypothetical protein FH972_026677 [Carpinus fangiana]|uniref:Uncharacterized protein n=1 Tax=Carpinus fangiana TaxID=176857 RepID=A0A5N6L526_9ROSI|nr:hypothetical protein FH972_026677 [Carpinus fangiana]
MDVSDDDGTAPQRASDLIQSAASSSMASSNSEDTSPWMTSMPPSLLRQTSSHSTHPQSGSMRGTYQRPGGMGFTHQQPGDARLSQQSTMHRYDYRGNPDAGYFGLRENSFETMGGRAISVAPERNASNDDTNWVMPRTRPIWDREQEAPGNLVAQNLSIHQQQIHSTVDASSTKTLRRSSEHDIIEAPSKEKDDREILNAPPNAPYARMGQTATRSGNNVEMGPHVKSVALPGQVNHVVGPDDNGAKLANVTEGRLGRDPSASDTRTEVLFSSAASKPPVDSATATKSASRGQRRVQRRDPKPSIDDNDNYYQEGAVKWNTFLASKSSKGRAKMSSETDPNMKVLGEEEGSAASRAATRKLGQKFSQKDKSESLSSGTQHSRHSGETSRSPAASRLFAPSPSRNTDISNLDGTDSRSPTPTQADPHGLAQFKDSARPVAGISELTPRRSLHRRRSERLSADFNAVLDQDGDADDEGGEDDANQEDGTNDPNASRFWDQKARPHIVPDGETAEAPEDVEESESDSSVRTALYSPRPSTKPNAARAAAHSFHQTPDSLLLGFPLPPTSTSPEQTMQRGFNPTNPKANRPTTAQSRVTAAAATSAANASKLSHPEGLGKESCGPITASRPPPAPSSPSAYEHFDPAFPRRHLSDISSQDESQMSASPGRFRLRRVRPSQPEQEDIDFMSYMTNPILAPSEQSDIHSSSVAPAGYDAAMGVGPNFRRNVATPPSSPPPTSPESDSAHLDSASDMAMSDIPALPSHNLILGLSVQDASERDIPSSYSPQFPTPSGTFEDQLSTMVRHAGTPGFVEGASRTMVIFNLPLGCSYAEIAALIWGGPLEEIKPKPEEGWASVTFLHVEDCSRFATSLSQSTDHGLQFPGQPDRLIKFARRIRIEPPNPIYRSWAAKGVTRCIRITAIPPSIDSDYLIDLIQGEWVDKDQNFLRTIEWALQENSENMDEYAAAVSVPKQLQWQLSVRFSRFHDATDALWAINSHPDFQPLIEQGYLQLSYLRDCTDTLQSGFRDPSVFGSRISSGSVHEWTSWRPVGVLANLFPTSAVAKRRFWWSTMRQPPGSSHA